MKCGHCKGDHATVAEARQCAGVPARPAGPRIYSSLSPGQQKFLSDLLSQLGLVLSDDRTVETISYIDGKQILDGLVAARRLKATGKSYTLPDGVRVSSTPPRGGERRPRRKPLPDCPVGFYAIHDWTGREELRFFRVKIKQEGRFAGELFVDEVIGGRPEKGLDYPLSRRAIREIHLFGLEDSALLYGIKIKQCSKCNKSLTKKASRKLGLGRKCAYDRGKGEAWDDLNRTYNDADAEDDE